MRLSTISNESKQTISASDRLLQYGITTKHQAVCKRHEQNIVYKIVETLPNTKRAEANNISQQWGDDDT